VINSIDVQAIQCLVHIFRRPFLACVGHAFQAQVTRTFKHGQELVRRVADFRGIQADAHDAIQEGHGLLQRGKSSFLIQMAQKAHDDTAADPQFLLAPLQGRPDTFKYGFKSHPPIRMPLRVEKDFGVHDIVIPAALQVSPCQVIKVLRGEEHRHALVI
jgi:hypothetical protein